MRRKRNVIPRHELIKLICAECGNPFDTRKFRPGTYCSNKCRYDHYNRTHDIAGRLRDRREALRAKQKEA